MMNEHTTTCRCLQDFSKNAHINLAFYKKIGSEKSLFYLLQSCDEQVIFYGFFLHYFMISKPLSF